MLSERELAGSLSWHLQHIIPDSPEIIATGLDSFDLVETPGGPCISMKVTVTPPGSDFTENEAGVDNGAVPDLKILLTDALPYGEYGNRCSLCRMSGTLFPG